MDDENGGLSPPVLQQFFEDYAEGFNQALAGRPDMAAMTRRFAPVFIGAGPNGVEAARNDSDFPETLEKGYDFYRTIGAKRMTARGVEVTDIDRLHALATVHWEAEYEPRPGRPEAIGFDMHYLMQALGGAPRIVAYIGGDDRELLLRHGLL